MRYLIMHTASLYYWFDNYEATLDERIHAILDAGADGVELSNGTGILSWQPAPETLERLKQVVVAIHAEVGARFGVKPEELKDVATRLPNLSHIVFHPDELTPEEAQQLSDLPFYATLENMGGKVNQWQTADQLNPPVGVGVTFDTAHAQESGVMVDSFKITPYEVHLSLTNQDYYNLWGYRTGHAMTQFDPDRFPEVPSASPIVTLEGLVPPDKDLLRDEIKFVRSKLT